MISIENKKALNVNKIRAITTFLKCFLKINFSSLNNIFANVGTIIKNPITNENKPIISFK